eukprot:1393667-Amorphochlora_amoeboformis.AAC.1
MPARCICITISLQTNQQTAAIAIPDDLFNIIDDGRLLKTVTGRRGRKSPLEGASHVGEDNLLTARGEVSGDTIAVDHLKLDTGRKNDVMPVHDYIIKTYSSALNPSTS